MCFLVVYQLTSHTVSCLLSNFLWYLRYWFNRLNDLSIFLYPFTRDHETGAATAATGSIAGYRSGNETALDMDLKLTIPTGGRCSLLLL